MNSAPPSPATIREHAVWRGALATLGVLAALALTCYAAAAGSLWQLGRALDDALGPHVGQCAGCVRAPAGAALLSNGAPVADVLQVGHPPRVAGRVPQLLFLARWRPDAPPATRTDTLLVAVLDTSAGVPRLWLRPRSRAAGPVAGRVYFTTAGSPIPVIAGVAPSP